MTETGHSFLQHLLKKRADVQKTGDKSSKDVTGALKEVDRQISQALKKNPITGKGVTKSGRED